MENTHTWTCPNDLGMTVQEYASTYKLSYETVRAKIIRYKEELEGHIKIRKKTKYLDDFAVEFLESHRKPKSEFSNENSGSDLKVHSRVNLWRNHNILSFPY